MHTIVKVRMSNRADKQSLGTEAFYIPNYSILLLALPASPTRGSRRRLHVG